MPLGAYAPLPLRLGGSDTDGLTAAQWLRLTNDLAAARRTLPFAVVLIDQNDGNPKVTWYSGRNGIGTSDWPTVSWNPTTTRTQVLFPASYEDRTGVRHRTRLVSAWGCTQNVPGLTVTTPGRVIVDDVTRSNLVTCLPVNRSGTALQSVSFILKVR